MSFRALVRPQPRSSVILTGNFSLFPPNENSAFPQAQGAKFHSADTGQCLHIDPQPLQTQIQPVAEYRPRLAGLNNINNQETLCRAHGRAETLIMRFEFLTPRYRIIRSCDIAL